MAGRRAPAADRLTPRRIAATAAFGEVLITAACAALTIPGAFAFLAVLTWLIATVALGFGLAIVARGRRAMNPTAAGVVIGSAVLGIALGTATRGRLTATFELRSTAHEPVPVNLSSAGATAEATEAAEART